MMNKLDHEIAEAIARSTEKAVKKKDAVWAKIERQLEDTHMSYRKKQKKKRPAIVGWVAAAAAVMLIFMAFTPVGEAAVEQIKRMFAPQQEVETQLEGETESATHDIHIGPTPSPESADTPAGAAENTPVMSYVIYVDEAHYTTETANGTDRIVPVNYPEDYPEVSVEITQRVGQTPESLKSEIKSSMAQAYFSVDDWASVDYPVEGLRLMALDADINAEKGDADAVSWDSKVARVYLVDNTAGGTFVITVKFFVEAEEGHGMRIEKMLESFTVVNTQAEQS